MKQNIEKITVSLPKETLKIADDNRERLGFENRSTLIDTALREYISQCLLKETGQADDRILPTDIKNMENHLARLSYKIAVELAQMNLIWASVLDISDESIRSLRGRAVSLLKKTKGYIPLSTANKNALEIDIDPDNDLLGCMHKRVYQTEIRDTLFNITCEGGGVDETTMDKVLRAIQYTVINSNERKESNTL